MALSRRIRANRPSLNCRGRLYTYAQIQLPGGLVCSFFTGIAFVLCGSRFSGDFDNTSAAVPHKKTQVKTIAIFAVSFMNLLGANRVPLKPA